MKILLWDIETLPIVGAIWTIFEPTLGHESILEDWSIVTTAWKWYGERKVSSISAFPGDPKNDKLVVQHLHKILSEADVIVHHNGDAFDIKKFNARAIFHGLPPLPPIPTVDTKKIAKNIFGFTCNRLDYLGKFLGVGGKISTGGIELWKKVMKGDKAAFAKMIRYNKQDVVVLEGVYKKLRPFMKNHPNHQRHSGVKCCPNCGSKKFTRNGTRHTQTRSYVRYVCSAPGCRHWFAGEVVK